MSKIEAKGYQTYKGPHLPVNSTVEFVNHIPPDEWKVPEPYGVLDHKRRMQAKSDDLIMPWIHFILSAQKGRKEVDEHVGKYAFSGNLPPIRSYNQFRFFDNLPDGSFEEKTASLLRGFGHLVSGDILEQLGIAVDDISDSDIQNVKLFVDNIGKKVNGIGLA